MCSTVLCAFWHMGFDLSLKLYYILFIILLILWNTSLYSYWVSQLHKIKSHQSWAWKSVLSETNTRVFPLPPCPSPDCHKRCSYGSVIFPFFHLWEKFHVWFLHLTAGFFSVAYSSGNVTSMCLWIPVCLEKEKKKVKHLLDLHQCWISPLYRIFLKWGVNIYIQF